MIYLKNDYSEGCHPEVLAALTRTNLEATTGYGEDEYCKAAAEKIKARFQCPDADVHFLVGGTQVNFTALDAFLRPWEAAIATSLGHIAVHETGAVEGTGHKVLTAPCTDGILTPQMVREIVAAHPNEHMVKPRIVYISDSTEVGTIYHKAELAALHDCCEELGLLLYLDGARLASALTSPENDIAPEDLPRYCDAFYVGGTKNGALFGEALVIVNDALKPDFRYAIKQHGGMLAKGRLLGLQFLALLDGEDGSGCSPYFTMAAEADRQALEIRKAFTEKGIGLLHDSPTNQQFFVLPDAWYNTLAEQYAMSEMGKPDEEHTAVRICTSWATRPEAVAQLIADVQKL